MSIRRCRQCGFARAFALIAVALMLLGIVRPAHAGPFFFYKFTIVADTKDGFPYKSGSGFGFPAINGSGRIAFHAVLSSGVEGMFTRLGTAGPNTLADTGADPYIGFGIAPSINALNTVLFVGLKNGGEVLLRGEGNSATPLISSSDDLFGFAGTQINIQKTAVFLAKRGDGRNVIRTQGAGPLTGVFRIIAVEGSEFSSLGRAPSIDFDGNVAFTATRNGRRAIFTRAPAPSNTLTQVIDDSSTFAGFSAVALNRQGGLAFTASLQGGGTGLFRIRNGVLTTIANTNVPGTAVPKGFSINESGQVVYELAAEANGSAVFRGPGRLFGRLVGSGSVLFGRTVAFAHVDRDSLNSTNQVAVWIGFTDGTEVIARGEPTSLVDTVLTGALQLTTAMGKSVTVDTPIPVPPAHLTLSFDVTFLTAGGELSVNLGDRSIKSIAASQPGVPQHVSIPIDVRAIAKDRPINHMGSLQFRLTGVSGASVQISDVIIPGLFADPMDGDALSRWRIDHSGGGSAAVVSTSRFPVRIRVDQPSAQASGGYGTVAVLSTRDFDASADIERSSLRLSGSALRGSRDQAGKEQVACEARDANADKLNDLVCEIDAAVLARSKSQELRLEAMTHYGWGIIGTEAPRGTAVQKTKGH